MPSLAGGHHPAMDAGRDAGRPADGMEINGNGAAIAPQQKRNLDYELESVKQK